MTAGEKDDLWLDIVHEIRRALHRIEQKVDDHREHVGEKLDDHRDRIEVNSRDIASIKGAWKGASGIGGAVGAAAGYLLNLLLR